MCQEYNIDQGRYLADGTIQNGKLVSFVCDRASVNTAAVQYWADSYKGSLDIGCFSHTLCHVGEHITCLYLESFRQDLSALMSQSQKACEHWLLLVRSAFKMHSATRWWSEYEQIVDLFNKWAELLDFVRTAVGDGGLVAGSRITRLKEMLIIDDGKRIRLLLELKIVKIVAEPFVKATYLLESDKCCALIAYDEIQKLRFHWSEFWVGVYPNESVAWPCVVDAIEVAAVAYHGCPENAVENKTVAEIKVHLMEQVVAMVKPSKMYFENVLLVKLSRAIETFKALRCVNPLVVARTNISAAVFQESVPRALLAERGGGHDDCFRSLQGFVYGQPSGRAGEAHGSYPAVLASTRP